MSIICSAAPPSQIIKHVHAFRNVANGGCMKCVVLILTLLIAIANCLAIRCYKCTVTAEKSLVRNATVVTPMCSKFDESEEYIVDCPFSTMCLKTISTLYLQNGQTQDTITRGCAQQKDTTQVFRNRQWQQEHSVQEVYEEGCIEFKQNNLAASGKTHCYCRGNLCNSAHLLRPPRMVLIKILTVAASLEALLHYR